MSKLTDPYDDGLPGTLWTAAGPIRRDQTVYSTAEGRAILRRYESLGIRFRIHDDRLAAQPADWEQIETNDVAVLTREVLAAYEELVKLDPPTRWPGWPFAKEPGVDPDEGLVAHIERLQRRKR